MGTGIWRQELLKINYVGKKTTQHISLDVFFAPLSLRTVNLHTYHDEGFITISQFLNQLQKSSDGPV